MRGRVGALRCREVREALVESGHDERYGPVGGFVAEVEIDVMHLDLAPAHPEELSHRPHHRRPAFPVPVVVGQCSERLDQAVVRTAEIGADDRGAVTPARRDRVGAGVDARVHQGDLTAARGLDHPPERIGVAGEVRHQFGPGPARQSRWAPPPARR